MKPLSLPNNDYLLSCFKYDSGALYWLERPKEHFRTKRAHGMWNAKNAGKRAGRQMIGKATYRQIGLDGVRYLEHRLIAALFGISVSNLIDHRDGNGLNNHPGNLRAATHSQNMKNNSGWSKKSEPCGVHLKANGRWVAYIRADGKHKHLGTFTTQAEALSVRRSAEQRHYGEFASARGVELERVAA